MRQGSEILVRVDHVIASFRSELNSEDCVGKTQLSAGNKVERNRSEAELTTKFVVHDRLIFYVSQRMCKSSSTSATDTIVLSTHVSYLTFQYRHTHHPPPLHPHTRPPSSPPPTPSHQP